MIQHFGLPELFRARLAALVPESMLEAAIASFSEPKFVTARINTLRARAEDVWYALEKLHLTPLRLSWFSDAFVLPACERDILMSSKLYQEAAVYLQNASSLLPVVVLDPQPEEEVLDMAAAPGSKTLQLTCAMQGRGRIAAVEAVRSRFFKLKANLAGQGATMVHCYHADASTLWRKVPERFDRILLDAPCSSESRFRGDEPESYTHWGLRKVEEMARKQKQLLHSAIRCLKPGGNLVYSTCSFSPEENEAVIDRALQLFGPALRIEPVKLPDNSNSLTAAQASTPKILPGRLGWRDGVFDSSLVNAGRVVPDVLYDGFFICCLRKVASVD